MKRGFDVRDGACSPSDGRQRTGTGVSVKEGTAENVAASVKFATMSAEQRNLLCLLGLRRKAAERAKLMVATRLPQRDSSSVGRGTLPARGADQRYDHRA
jgi:hypothetical protein